MKPEIKNLLLSCFQPKELYLDLYFSNCLCFAISDDYEIYELKKNHIVDFKLAGVLFYNKDANLIQIFGVDPNLRGKKYGYYLLKYLVEDFLPENRSRGTIVKLHVRVSNTKAIELYTKVGFKIDERTESYYKYTDDEEDAYLMSYRI